MRIDILDIGGVKITLSRRNLKALLAKLDGNPRDSFRTLVKLTDKGVLVVVAEEDEAHYGKEKPGRMVPETEVLL